MHTALTPPAQFAFFRATPAPDCVVPVSMTIHKMSSIFYYDIELSIQEYERYGAYDTFNRSEKAGGRISGIG